MVSGTTQVVAVIGHPIAQVKSPDNFNRYFAEQHMDSVMIPVDIAPVAAASAAPSPGDCARRGSVGWPCTIKPRPPGSACMTFWLRPFRRCN